jgi:DnaJ-domain-containing protein 1
MGRMSVFVPRLTERNLDATFAKAPYLLVRVDRGPMLSMHQGLPEVLDRRFPNLLAFGTVSRTDFSAVRLTELFQSEVGRLRSGVGDGYWLFHAGLVVGHHSGQVRPSSVSYGKEAEEEAQRAKILSDLAASGVFRGADVEALRQLVAYLEPLVQRRQRGAGFGAGADSSGGYASPPPSTPPPAAPRSGGPDPDDPYVILGIERTATAEEIKAAYRTQLKLNHPDKVAHLSPALQQFAAQQTLRVMQAYEALVRRNGG